jgi:hypothetical protein
MKKRLLKKVLSAFVILAVSSCLINMHGQVKVIFENGDDREDRQQGIAGRDALHLNYTIDGSGNIALDAVTPATDEGIIASSSTAGILLTRGQRMLPLCSANHSPWY